MDDLIRNVKGSSLGVTMGDVRVSILLYADDIALVAENAGDMQRMLDLCDQFAAANQMKFNIKKSNAITFPRLSEQEEKQNKLTLSGLPMQFVDEYTYLGVEIGKFVLGKGSKESRWQSYIDRVYSSALRRHYEVLKVCGHEDGLKPHIALQLYYTHVRARVEYAAQIWGVQTSSRQDQKLEEIQQNFARCILNLPQRAAKIYAPIELGLLPLRLRRHMLALRYWVRICTQDDDRLPKRILMNYLNTPAKKRGPLKHTWAHSLYKLIKKEYTWLESSLQNGEIPLPPKGIDANTSEEEKIRKTREHWYKRIETEMWKMWSVKWKEDAKKYNTLRYFRNIKTSTKMEDFLRDSNTVGMKAKLLLRSGTYPLGGTNKMTDAITECICCDERKCETRAHFLLHCKYYDVIRRKWMEDVMSKARKHEVGEAMTAALARWMNEAKIAEKGAWQSATTSDIEEKQMNFLLGADMPDKVIEVLCEAERRRAETRKDQQPLNLQTQLCRLVDKSTRKMLQLLERARQLLIQEKRRRNNNPKHQTP
jgi:hypothetical protein